jgi:transposase
MSGSRMSSTRTPQITPVMSFRDGLRLSHNGSVGRIRSMIDAVAEMDLSAFYAAYRADGQGRAAYEPSLMVALILYAFATRVRSSRAIECHCRQDVAYRVVTGNLVPDHATIARFICRHERALAELFAEVLKLCDRAGLVRPGVVSIDGTRIAGNASPAVNYRFDQMAREIVAEVRATDEAEDEAFGEAW